MAISRPVHRYYAERIFARTSRDEAPPNFRPLERPHSGMATVEGCRGGGKNIVEVFLVVEAGQVRDVRVSCGLCNPAMYVAMDVRPRGGTECRSRSPRRGAPGRAGVR